MPVHFKSFPKDDAVGLLGNLFSQATKVEIAAGYFYASGISLLRPQIEAFLQNRNHALRVLVSDSYEQTEGEAVRTLLDMRGDCIRFFDPNWGTESNTLSQPGGIFHPKAFCFHLPQGRRSLLGSANFSYRAWKQNVEWCYLVEEDAQTADSLNDLTADFEHRWNLAPPISSVALHDFITKQKQYLDAKKGITVMPEWKVGDVVRHKSQPKLGLGEVKFLSGDQVGVKFEGGALKEVAANNLIAAQGPLQLLGSMLRGETAASPETYDLRTQARFLQLVHGNTGALSRARVDILPHQMLAAHRVVSSDPMRWIVADDVGLGKTIEAGLMIAALRAKSQAERVLIVVPAGLRQQWQDELREKFNMTDFALFQAAMMKAYGTDTSQVWKQTTRLIASIDTLAQPHIRETLKDSKWDLVIFDEAHKLSAYDGYYSDRYRLAEFLRKQATVGASVYLTATPHQGIHSKFWHLMNLVKPELFTKESKWDSEKKHLPEAMMRSRKSQVTTMSGKALFPDPPTTIQIAVTLTEPELQFYSALHTYLRTGYLTADKASSSDTKARAIGFTMTTFQKLASSSPYAIRGALLNRLQVLAPRSALAKGYIPDADGTYVMDADADARTKEENIAAAAELRYAREFFKEETVQLTQLIKLLDKVTSAGAKWTAFQKAITGCLKRNPTENILIFTEYRRTQKFLAERLGNRYGKVKIALIHGGLTLQERMESAARFNRKEVQFLISTEAGGEGINLQDECHILFNYDMPWNPMRLHQRIGRLDRYGQKDPVKIFQFYQDGEILVKEGRRTRRVPLVDDRVQKILETKIQDVVNDIGQLNPDEEPENIRDYLLGELAEAKGFSFAKMFRQAVVQENPEAAEKMVSQALKTIDSAKSAFSSVLAGVPGFAMGEYEAIRPEAGMEEVHAFAESFLRLHKTKLATDGDKSFRIKLPSKLRLNTKIKESYEQLTFDRSRAARDKNLDLLAFGHEFFDMMVERALDQDFGHAATVRNVVASDKTWKGRVGAEFHFIITLLHEDSRAAREKWITVFVDQNGTAQLETTPSKSGKRLALLTSAPTAESRRGSTPPTKTPKKSTRSLKLDTASLADEWVRQAHESARALAESERNLLFEELRASHPDGATPTIILDLFAASATRFI